MHMKTSVAVLAVSLLSLPAVTQGVAAVSPDATQQIIVTRIGSEPSVTAPTQYFTGGSVRLDPLFQNAGPSDMSASYVTFEAGAHSVWHTHPRGQTLIVTAGVGRVQRWGDVAQEIRPGDVIWIPPGQKHWHGATPVGPMTHIAMQGAVGGKNVEWLEPVTQEQYRMATNTKTNADYIKAVSPALEHYTQNTVEDVWKRPGLSVRDRSLVTLAVLIARNQTAELPTYLNRALDSGLKAAEISETVTHLAFYSGWGSGMSAVPAVRDVFRARGIGPDQLPPAKPPLLAINQLDEERRAAFVEQSVGPVAPGVVHYTSDPLFHDVWLRPALAPRDRSLVTISAMIGTGQLAQFSAHLNRALDNGLTQAEAGEVLTHLLFYAGWPNVFTAVPIAKDVFAKRPR
jgi:4-carboxymuconolactone decarboxylase